MDAEHKHMVEFSRLVGELTAVHQKKIAEYGLSRYRPEAATHNLRAAFFDIDRKYIRLRYQMDGGKIVDMDALRETFMDLASYGIMGMQILDIMKEREDGHGV